MAKLNISGNISTTTKTRVVSGMSFSTFAVATVTSKAIGRQSQTEVITLKSLFKPARLNKIFYKPKKIKESITNNIVSDLMFGTIFNAKQFLIATLSLSIDKSHVKDLGKAASLRVGGFPISEVGLANA